jgi:histidyl-tRNA synthetase
VSDLKAVRGTRDLIGEDLARHRLVVDRFRALAERYGFEAIETPVFEFTDVFKRTLGETTDVVTKEMYTFEDKGGESLTLRPEPTAGIARAFLSNGWQQNLPLKLSTSGPMFRYERPQKGRLRQFHQLDVEILGVAEPQADIELIALGQNLLDELGIARHVTLELNTLGDTESRTAYREVLVDYFRGFLDDLSPESKDRLERNPLRILDSKDPNDRALIADAPKLDAYLNTQSQDFFASLLAGLDALGIRYQRNPALVRGFDYYSHTAFEFTTTALGAQGTVIGGGRYDRLIEFMGGQPTPGVGWGAGIERLSMLVAVPPAAPRPVVVVPVGADAQNYCLALAADLRRKGFIVDMGYRGNVGKRLKQADRRHAAFALLAGGDEMARGTVTLRQLDAGLQEEVALGALAERLKALGA